MPREPGLDLIREDASATRVGRHMRVLEELAEIGMRLARDVERQALADEPRLAALPDPALLNSAGRARTDWALVFARIARAVRQTVALEAKLAAEAEERGRQVSAAEDRRAALQKTRVRQQKVRVKRLVEDAIAAEADAGEAEGLLLDLDERLADPDIEDELGSRPIGVIFAAICADLGIEADLRGFSDAELGFDIAPARPAGGSRAALAGEPDPAPATSGEVADGGTGSGAHSAIRPGCTAEIDDPARRIVSARDPPGCWVASVSAR